MKIDAVGGPEGSKARRAMLAMQQQSIQADSKPKSDFSLSNTFPQPKADELAPGQTNLLNPMSTATDTGDGLALSRSNRNFIAKVDQLIQSYDTREEHILGGEKEVRDEVQKMQSKKNVIDANANELPETNPDESVLSKPPTPDKFAGEHGYLPQISDSDPSSSYKIESDKESENKNQQQDENEDEQEDASNEESEESLDAENEDDMSQYRGEKE